MTDQIEMMTDDLTKTRLAGRKDNQLEVTTEAREESDGKERDGKEDG